VMLSSTASHKEHRNENTSATRKKVISKEYIKFECLSALRFQLLKL
jgi:hypothetical protein